MGIPTRSNEFIARARKMLGKGTIYKLGKGGLNPNTEYAYDSVKGLDCSGFVAWCMGISRHTTNSFYVGINGNGIKGWFETTAAYKDALNSAGFLTKIDKPVRGCIVVYGDYIVNGQRKQGHIGIVTEVSETGKALKVIHCSSSGYATQGDAIQENISPALLNNSKAIFAAYDKLEDHRAFFDRGVTINHTIPADDMLTGNSTSNSRSDELIPVFEFVKNGKLVYRAWGFAGEKPFFYQSGAFICADGAPDAYKIADMGSDYLANAGKPPFPGAPTDKHLDQWKWWALVTDPKNNPVVQNENDPYPGFFVSTTAHVNTKYAEIDPRRYINANEIPFIVLPKKNSGGAKLGDFAFIINRKTDLSIPAIYSEVGPKESIGEISMAAAKMLNIPSNPRKGGMSKKDLFYIVFPGSGNGKVRDIQEIKKNATKFFKDWGGLARVKQIPDLQL